jgi:uncharacterized membrane protein
MVLEFRPPESASLGALGELLFWLSLTPFVTAWVGETHFAPEPLAVYAVLQLLAGVAFYLLALALVAVHGTDSVVSRTLGAHYKAKASIVLYVASVPLAFVSRVVACLLFAAVALIWLVPDRRIEQAVAGLAR